MQEFSSKKLLTEALGVVVRRLHSEANLSSRAVAYGVGISKTTLLLIEQGKLDPQISTFCKIAEAFYLRPDELMSLVLNELPEQWSIID